MTNEIVESTGAQLPANQADQTFQLLQQAVQQGTDPEALEKLVSLQERILAHQAQAEFTRALAEFQTRCPVIEKRHAVKDRSGRLMYKFAPLEDIVAQIRPLLAECGLSYAFNTEVDDKGGARVDCIIRHLGGHSETSSVYIPPTSGHNTNASQNMGIQLTYGKRYALIGALGITTADEDPDGQVQKLRPISADLAADLESLAEEVGADKQKFLRYMAVSSFSEIPERDYERALKALEQKRRRG